MSQPRRKRAGNRRCKLCLGEAATSDLEGVVNGNSQLLASHSQYARVSVLAQKQCHGAEISA